MRRLAILGVPSSLAMLAARSCVTGDKTAAPPIQSNATTVNSSAVETATEPALDNTPSAANDETAFRNIHARDAVGFSGRLDCEILATRFHQWPDSAVCNTDRQDGERRQR